MSGRIVVMDGNIGAGKTTLCGTLNKDNTVFFEPSVKNPVLSNYYKDKRSFCFKMEEYLIKQRIGTYKKALELKKIGDSVVLDRSIFSSLYFVEMNRALKNLTKDEYDCLLDMITKCKFPAPDKVVYLYKPVNLCMKAVKDRYKRNNVLESERFITAEYLQSVEKYLEKWYASLKVKKVKIDWSTHNDNKPFVL